MCFVLDASQPFGRGDQWVANLVPKDAVCVVNKVDKASREAVLAQLDAPPASSGWRSTSRCRRRRATAWTRWSAHLVTRLPEGPQYFPDDMVTDVPEAFWVSELVREQLLRRTRDELPHSIAARVTEWDWPYVRCEILVERDSQKGIVIGKKGQVLKEVGIAVREQLPEGTYLDLQVKVDKDWQSRPAALERLGLLQPTFGWAMTVTGPDQWPDTTSTGTCSNDSATVGQGPVPPPEAPMSWRPGVERVGGEAPVGVGGGAPADADPGERVPGRVHDPPVHAAALGQDDVRRRCRWCPARGRGPGRRRASSRTRAGCRSRPRPRAGARPVAPPSGSDPARRCERWAIPGSMNDCTQMPGQGLAGGVGHPARDRDRLPPAAVALLDVGAGDAPDGLARRGPRLGRGGRPGRAAAVVVGAVPGTVVVGSSRAAWSPARR